MIPKFEVRAELGNINSELRTVDVTWSTGSKGLRNDPMIGSYYEELSMDPKHVDMERLNSGAAPVLAIHDRASLDAVHGVVEKAWIENGKGVATLRFSESDPAADMTYKKIKERILRNVSVGYTVSEFKDISKKGDQYPTLIATRWQPQEISIVPIGFDMKAVTRSNEQQMNEVEIVAQRSEQNTERSMLENQNQESQTQVDVAALKSEAAKEAILQERSRVADIHTAVRAAKLEDTVAQDLITRGLSSADAAKEIFKKLEEKSAQTEVKQSMNATITRDEKDTKVQGVQELLMNRVDNKSALTDNGKRFYGMSLSRIAEELIGGRPLGMNDMQVATRALSTSDLPNILANVAEKSMRNRYQAQAQSFKPWTKSGTLRNYKTANRLMLGDFPSLEQVNERGEFKSGSVAESKETIKINRYGKEISFSKEMIVNDDLNALSDFATKAGLSAASLESDLVYTSTLIANPTMGDGNALFSSAHSNYVSSGTAISVSSMALAYAAIRNQKNVDGTLYLNLEPKFLIVGPAREMTARQFVSVNLLAQQVSNINIFAGKLEVIVDPRITDNSWYVAADPASIDTIELAKLEGEDGPLMTVDKGMTVGSIKITCEHNVGAAALDYRGLYLNAGA